MSDNVQHPKVVVIGAGSLFFGRQAVWQMVHSPILNQGTLALVDTDAERLDAMSTLAEKVIAYNDVPLKLETASDWKDVLPGADFVVLSFAEDTVRYRGIDCILSEKYGIRMCSGDTIGPGGIFRAMREFPVILDAVKDIERLCPDAWTINYINPSTVHGIGLMRYAPQLKSFALCDSLHMPWVKMRNAGRAGIIKSKEEYTRANRRRLRHAHRRRQPLHLHAQGRVSGQGRDARHRRVHPQGGGHRGRRRRHRGQGAAQQHHRPSAL